jgi:RHS repeat-associated protein
MVTYAYDALGRRIQRTSTISGTTNFVLDVVRDLDGTGSTIADYLNGPGIDNKLRQIVGGVPSYFVTDHLGTTRALTDASGTVTFSFGYDSFGNVTSGSATRYTYTGRERDPDTGLMYYRARWYDPQMGRFISEDPIGFHGGEIDLYVYVRNNATRFHDPLGLRRCNPILGAIAGGVGGGVIGGLGGGGLGALGGAAIGCIAGGLGLGTLGTLALPGGGNCKRWPWWLCRRRGAACRAGRSRRGNRWKWCRCRRWYWCRN